MSCENLVNLIINEQSDFTDIIVLRAIIKYFPILQWKSDDGVIKRNVIKLNSFLAQQCTMSSLLSADHDCFLFSLLRRIRAKLRSTCACARSVNTRSKSTRRSNNV